MKDFQGTIWGRLKSFRFAVELRGTFLYQGSLSSHMPPDLRSFIIVVEWIDRYFSDSDIDNQGTDDLVG